MLMFIIGPQKLTESQLSGLEEELRTFFSTGDGSDLVVHSLLLATSGQGRDRPNIRCVSGEAFIHEEVEKKFGMFKLEGS